MTKTAQTTPNTLTDDSLDEISGGPHFRTWDNHYYDFQSGCDTVLSKNDNMELHARLAQQTASADTR